MLGVANYLQKKEFHLTLNPKVRSTSIRCLSGLNQAVREKKEGAEYLRSIAVVSLIIIPESQPRRQDGSSAQSFTTYVCQTHHELERSRGSECG